MTDARTRADESLALAAQAERARRGGDAARARELAHAALEAPVPHPAARLAQVLALIDSGDLVTAHRALEAAYEALGGEVAEPEPELASAEPVADALPALADDELEDAFETAEAERDEMHDANHVAAAAVEAVEEGAPEVDLTSERSPFATETVASLLERQGQRERAGEVRSAVRARGQFREQRLDDVRRAHVVETLSRWLDNLRRRTA